MIKIVEILKARKCVELLEFFLEKPETELYQTQIVKNVNISKATVLKWLGVLASYDLLKTRTEGRLKRYKLNLDNPIAKQLKILIMVSKLYSIALTLKGVEAYLYGSAARGEDTEKSDIDILIIGKIERKKLVEFAEIAKKIMKREVKPIILTPLEYSNLIRKDRIFYDNVEKSKIRLI